jgi:NAD(P)-dependent dehydrogenase (short-subunit alcohol dehydrogenase family)
MAQLTGRVVLITGAKGGLGTSVTEEFLAAGAQVVGSSRSIRDSDFPHPGFSAVAAELSSRDAAAQLVAAVLAKHGRVDALVHLLGGFAGGPAAHESDDATLERMLEMNFRSAFHIIGAVLPPMRAQKAGSILAIGSRAALEPAAGLSAYSASKAALISLVRTVAVENKEWGISANVVLPGTMDTPVNRGAMPGADFSRWVQPKQVARLLAHLASEDASQISGALIPVYGAEA